MKRVTLGILPLPFPGTIPPVVPSTTTPTPAPTSAFWAKIPTWLKALSVGALVVGGYKFMTRKK